MIPPIFYGDEWGMVYLNIPYELPKKKGPPLPSPFAAVDLPGLSTQKRTESDKENDETRTCWCDCLKP